MKRRIQILLLIGISFILYGCPYDSHVPIDDPKANSIDLQLLGRWKNRSDGTIYTFRKYDDHTYSVSYSTKTDVVSYYPFMSFVNNMSFLCVPHDCEYGEGDDYYLFGITIGNNGNTLTIKGLNNPSDYITAKTSAELRSWIYNNMNSSSFYSTVESDNYVLDKVEWGRTEAVSDGFVGSMNSIINDYPNKFSNITGALLPEFNDGIYESKVTIPGSSYSRILNTSGSGLLFSAGYVNSYTVADENNYQAAVKQFNKLVAIFESSSFSIPLVKGKIKNPGNYQRDMGDVKEIDFTSSSNDERFRGLVVRIKVSKNNYVTGQNQMDPRSWKQYFATSITINR